MHRYGCEIYNNPLDIEDVKNFLKITDKYGLLSYLTANFGVISTVELPETNIYKVLNKTLPDKDKIKLEVIHNIDNTYAKYKDEILKGVCIEKENKEALLAAKEELRASCPNLEIVSSWDDNFEVMKKGSSKGDAVKALTEYFGLTSDEVMCIGDSENDLSMIKFAGVGVAMGNAISSVKEAAQFVTFSNTDAGVAHAIKKFI